MAEAFELMVRILLLAHSVLAKLQPTTTLKLRKGRFSESERHINIFGRAQLLKASGVTEALEKDMSQRGEIRRRMECERLVGFQVFVCVGGAALLPPGSFS